MPIRPRFPRRLSPWLVGLLFGVSSSALLAQSPPPPGASPRIDAIKKAGELRVGVLQNAPWLILYPSLALMVTVVSFNLVGDGLRDAMFAGSGRA